MTLKLILTASVLALAASTGAHAACNVSGNALAFAITGQLSESDCASTAAVNGQVSGLQGQIDVGAVHDAAQDTAIGGKADKSDVDAENAVQDGKIDGLAGAVIVNYAIDAHQQHEIHQGQQHDAEQDGKIHGLKQKNEQQDHRLDQQRNAIVANYAWDAHQQQQIGKLGYENKQQWQAIGALADWNYDQDKAISAHTAVLSAHSARLDSHEKGLAIAMAMPDTWLQAGEKFAVAGNLGGFGDETALAFAGIARLDETWSLNGGLGADTEFEEFGWKVGARAGW